MIVYHNTTRKLKEDNMTSAVDQYRALVAKLEAINPSQLTEDLKIGDIDPRNGQKILSAMTDGEGNVVRSGSGEIWNVKYGPADAPAPTPAPAPDNKPEEPVVTPVADQPDIKPEPLPDVVPEPTPSPEEKCGPEVKAQIMAQKTFNAAYAMARKAECPEFDWCQIVNVPEQGGKTSDPWFNAPGMGTGSVVTPNGKPTFAPVKEDEQLIPSTEGIDRMREIAGTDVIKEAGGIPEIKAGSKEKAIEIARKKGIKTFKYCGKYKVKAATKPEQGPMKTPEVPSAAVVGNPTISRQTAPGNPNTRPGSLRDRAAQANAARRPEEPRFPKQ